jgi:uncharacterized alpha-E superfamily protein
MMENMTREAGWLFLDLGRRIERAIQTTVLMHSLLVPAAGRRAQSALMEAVLATVDSLMTYRRRYRRALEAGDVLELVLYDAGNPRSIAYQLSRIEEHISNLPRVQQKKFSDELQRASLETVTMVRLADVRRLAATEGDPARRARLDEFLSTLATRLPALSDRISDVYFRAAETPHQLLRPRSRTGT